MKRRGAGGRILVVEDEPAICRVCVRALTSEGFEVDTAANGEVAQRMIGEREYDLFLIDVRTPVINGKELYWSMSEKHPQLIARVIFTTGDVISKDTQSFLETANRPFIPKPFTPIELRTTFRTAMEQLRNAPEDRAR